MNSDLKLIRHNVARYNQPDDPSYPWRLDASFRLQGIFMDFAAIMLFGPSEIIQVRSRTQEALEEFVITNGLRNHPRLIKLEITRPETVLV